ncbi:cell division protein FtsX [Aliifodinibius salipaludis]|uniref:Cell division protein FtsX n=1 Tax=Fodinibius salipaludis TaxID=2032627 RepID=A0A2A2GDI3_9BACT|nr:ABC transporter permease [Aliifodinibius salipaludis]PAU95240.1 cell division protein FtsX [Aliifodinibius salipaludis]
MIKNYLKIAFRNLGKRKGFTFINVLGLAIGIASCLLIAAYVLHELSYDQFHEKSDRIYRVTQTTETSSKNESGATTPFPVGPTLQNDFSGQIEKTVRFFDMQEEVRTILNAQTEESFRVDHFYVVDSTFFDVFSADLVRGNPKTALDEPRSAVITEEQARRFFGDENPIGKQLIFKGVEEFTVTGVMKALPETSHFQVDMLVSFNSLPELYGSREFLERWFWNPCWTYVLLKDGVAPQELESQFSGFVDKNYADREKGETITLSLQSLTDIHLYSNLDQEMEANGSIFYVYLFSVVAVLILVIAGINFMNLSTARSTERAREVGIRRVLGAQRGQLFGQFMGESMLMTGLGFLMALFLVYLSLPWFNKFLNIPLGAEVIMNGKVIAGLLILFVIVALLAGLYPALYLSGFKPVSIMHGSKSTQSGAGEKLLRKGLVVFQFTLSVVLIIGTLIVYLQLQHMQDKKMGFDQEQVVVMPITQTLIAWEFDQFKEKALKSPHITGVTGMSKILGSDRQIFSKYSPANQPDAPPTNMTLHVRHDFLETYGIELLAGRSFSRDYPADAENSILINKSMLNQINAQTPRDALGARFYYTTAEDERKPFEVIGVVDDFNYTSIKKEISPLVINLVKEGRPTVRNIEFATVKLAAGSTQNGIEDLRATWKGVNHIDPFTYFFQDEKLKEIYKSEAQMSSVSGFFTLLCILVACLGLFGLASYTASRRTKEIGIRKTLGASVPNIVALLSKDYLKLIVISNIIAWPVIYYLVVQWLQEFPYRIELGWNLAAIFVTVGIVTIGIGLLTVSYQSLRAALINPVDSIQQE